jgi:hypothetical protein
MPEKAGCIYQKDPFQCGKQKVKLFFPRPKKSSTSNYKAKKYDESKTFEDPSPKTE